MTPLRTLVAWLHPHGSLAAQAAPRGALPWASLGLVLASGSGAYAQDLTGTYNPSSQRIEVQVITWGEDCGTRPESQVVQPLGPVHVKPDGAHLVLRFTDRTLRTNGCWSPNPAVKLVSATSADGRFRAECKTPQGDAKRELGRYMTTVAAGVIELLEESDYDWQLKKSHCVAKLRMTQTLTSTKLPLSVASPPSTPAPASVDAAVAAPAACVPGAPTRLRVRPAEAHIAPGERVCFSVRAWDAAGCSVELAASAVSYALQRREGLEGTLSGACFKAADTTALAEGQFKLVATSAGLRSEANIAVSAPDLSDITARRGPSSSGPLGSQRGADETALESGIRAVASSSHGMLRLGVAIAGLATLLSLIAIGALRMARRQLSGPPPPRPSAPAPASVPPAPALPVIAVPALEGPQRICPRCRRGYPPGSQRCDNDGETLLDYDVFAKQSAPRAAARHCQECGEPLTPQSLFCGRCGAKAGG
jgi:hypothetical protein